jgi:hypothetical protein
MSVSTLLEFTEREHFRMLSTLMKSLSEDFAGIIYDHSPDDRVRIGKATAEKGELDSALHQRLLVHIPPFRSIGQQRFRGSA